MVPTANAILTFTSHPMVANVPELARAVVVKVLLRVHSVLKIVSFANPSCIWRAFVVPLRCLATWFSFTVLVIVAIVVTGLAKHLGVTLLGCLHPRILGTSRKNVGYAIRRG